MLLKYEIMDADKMQRAIVRISHEIVEKNDGLENVVLVGIRKRGVPLANMIARNIHQAYQVDVPVGILDISLYRDDVKKESFFDQAKVNSTNISFDISGKKVILVDDVLFTGRTVRAAIDALIALGRPQLIQLAVLIDRGHRELPIRADYVGKNVPTSLSETVAVNIEEIDRQENVLLFDINN